MSGSISVFVTLDGEKHALLRPASITMPCDMTDVELVALAKSQALCEDMSRLGLTPATSSVFLIACDDTWLPQRQLIVEDVTPWAAAKAFAGEGVCKIKLLIERNTSSLAAPAPGPAVVATGGASASSGGGAGGGSAWMATGGALGAAAGGGGATFPWSSASVPPFSTTLASRRPVTMGVQFSSVWYQELYIRNTTNVRATITNLAREAKHIHGSIMRFSKDAVRLIIIALDEGVLASFQEAVNAEFGEHISGAPDRQTPVAVAEQTSNAIALEDARKAFKCVATKAKMILEKPSLSPNQDTDYKSEAASSASSPLAGMSARSFGSH